MHRPYITQMRLLLLLVLAAWQPVAAQYYQLYNGTSCSGNITATGPLHLTSCDAIIPGGQAISVDCFNTPPEQFYVVDYQDPLCHTQYPGLSGSQGPISDFSCVPSATWNYPGFSLFVSCFDSGPTTTSPPTTPSPTTATPTTAPPTTAPPTTVIPTTSLNTKPAQGFAASPASSFMACSANFTVPQSTSVTIAHTCGSNNVVDVAYDTCSSRVFVSCLGTGLLYRSVNSTTGAPTGAWTVLASPFVQPKYMDIDITRGLLYVADTTNGVLALNLTTISGTLAANFSVMPISVCTPSLPVYDYEHDILYVLCSSNGVAPIALVSIVNPQYGRITSVQTALPNNCFQPNWMELFANNTFLMVQCVAAAQSNTFIMVGLDSLGGMTQVNAFLATNSPIGGSCYGSSGFSFYGVANTTGPFNVFVNCGDSGGGHSMASAVLTGTLSTSTMTIVNSNNALIGCNQNTLSRYDPFTGAMFTACQSTGVSFEFYTYTQSSTVHWVSTGLVGKSVTFDHYGQVWSLDATNVYMNAIVSCYGYTPSLYGICPGLFATTPPPTTVQPTTVPPTTPVPTTATPTTPVPTTVTPTTAAPTTTPTTAPPTTVTPTTPIPTTVTPTTAPPTTVIPTTAVATTVTPTTTATPTTAVATTLTPTTPAPTTVTPTTATPTTPTPTTAVATTSTPTTANATVATTISPTTVTPTTPAATTALLPTNASLATTNSTSSSSLLSTGAIVGIAVGGAAAVAVVAGAVWYFTPATFAFLSPQAAVAATATV